MAANKKNLKISKLFDSQIQEIQQTVKELESLCQEKANFKKLLRWLNIFTLKKVTKI